MNSVARRDPSLGTLLALDARPHDYRDAATLLEAFWKEVESVMRDQGVWT